MIPLLVLLSMSCGKPKTIGSIEQSDASLDAIITPGSVVEVLADGYKWTEGPLWIEDQKMLLFSDVFANKVFKWTEAHGAEVYLDSSGYTATIARGGEFGSNGLLLSNEGKLVLCQHGNRQVAMMESGLNNPKPSFKTIAGAYQNKKLNSPNDAVYNQSGDLFFTDPPYGLEKNMDDPSKEIPFQGVYKVAPSGAISLMCDSLTRPNGIAFFPGQQKILVANSDSAKPNWYLFDVTTDSFTNGHIFYNASTEALSEKGLPDGLKIDRNGNVFATGPGGVFIFNSNGKLLGKIKLPVPSANCAFAPDEKTLYITASNYILRIKMRK